MVKSLLICTLAAAWTTTLCAGCTNPAPRNAPTAANSSAAGCVETGSRIVSKDNHCNGPGRAYSQTDIERTGQVDAGDALQRLDPSVTVHH